MYMLTPPASIAWMFFMLNLDWHSWKGLGANGFVKTSVTCSFVEIRRRWMTLDCNLSRTRWQSSSMCSVHLWNTGLWAICRADCLSQNKATSEGWGIVRSFNRYSNHCDSHVAWARAWYYTSEEERELWPEKNNLWQETL